jgi:hypothetical protein
MRAVELLQGNNRPLPTVQSILQQYNLEIQGPDLRFF